MSALPFSTSALLTGTFGLLVATYIASWIRSSQRLSHIPGPTGWGVTVIPWVSLHFKPDLMDQYYQLNKKFGPLVRVGPNTVITSDADTVRRMSAAQSPYRRSLNYYAMRLNPGKDHVFSTMDEATHNDLRKKMSAGYSGKENLTLENDIDSSILELCDLIDRKYVTTPENVRPMDLAAKIEYMVLDIISKASFDYKFHDIRDDNDNFGYIKEIHKLLPNVTWIAPIPGVAKFLTDIGFLQYAAEKADGQFGVEKVKRLAREQVDKRFETDGRPKEEMRSDMLGSFIRHGLSQERATEEAVLNLTAGSDTSATTIRAVLLNVMTRPRLYRLLTEEIDDAISRGLLSKDASTVITEDQAKQLPLLQATIREGLRWYPAVAAELSKVTPPEGDTICGYFVPGGTKVGCSIKAVHRNEELFGPDAESFRPERWLLSSSSTSPSDLTSSNLNFTPWLGSHLPTSFIHSEGHCQSPAQLYAMLRNNDLVFGSGRFQCLGKPVALLELNKIFVELLKRYEFSLMDILKPWEARCCGTHICTDMWVTVRRRDD